jgi:spore coat polysaccharide biosynthesis protein SpsF
LSKKVVLIIQARMSSSRLPGKSMLDLAGEPLIYRLLERVKRCQMVDEIVLAIPDSNENNQLVEQAKKSNVQCFRGSENDLLDRYYKAAKASNADIVGRIPADNPLSEPSEIDRIITHHKSLTKPSFSSNLAEVFKNGYPDGIGAEMMDFEILESAWLSETDLDKREHVHLNFYDYISGQAVDNKIFPVSTLDCPKEYKRPDLILDINTEEEYQFIKKIYDHLYNTNASFGIMDIIEWYDNIYVK